MCGNVVVGAGWAFTPDLRIFLAPDDQAVSATTNSPHPYQGTIPTVLSPDTGQYRRYCSFFTVLSIVACLPSEGYKKSSRLFVAFFLPGLIQDPFWRHRRASFAPGRNLDLSINS